jgi:hypothetical protein
MPTTTISLVFRSHFVVDKNDVNSGRYIVKEESCQKLAESSKLFIIPGPVVLTVIELVSVKSIISIESTVALEALTVMVRSATASRIMITSSINSHVIYAQCRESVVKSIPSFPNIIVIASGRIIEYSCVKCNKGEVRTN